MDEVLRLMSEVPGRELVVTANIGAYIRGPFGSYVAGPFEDEDFSQLIADGSLIKSFCSGVFVFNQQPPDFSDLNLDAFDLANIYTAEERAEILKNLDGPVFKLTADLETTKMFSEIFAKMEDQTNG